MTTHIEKLALLLHEIEENCVVLTGNDEFIFEDMPIIIPDYHERIHKKEWEQGIHRGDCIRISSPCAACWWADIVERGTRLSIAMTNGSKETLLEAINEDWEETNLAEHIEEKFLTELNKN